MNKILFLKNNIIVMTATVLGGFLGYLFHFMISRKLSVEQYGELQAITSLMIFLGVLSATLSYFIIKYSSVLAAHKDKVGQINFISFLRKKFRKPILFASFIYILLLPLIKSLLHLSNYTGIVSIGLAIIFSIYASFYLNSLQGWKKFFAVSIIGISAAFLKLICGWVLASLAPTASAVALSIFLSALIVLLAARAASQKAWPPPQNASADHKWREKYFSGENFRKNMVFIFLFSLAILGASNLDAVIIKNVVSAEITGYYAALSVLGKVILWLNLAVLGVLLPDAFFSGHEGKSVSKSKISLAYGMVFVISTALLAIYYLFPTLLMGLLFGQKYIAISGNLWLFGLMAIFLSLLTFESNLALARRNMGVVWILAATVILLATFIYLHHANLKEIIISVISAYGLGWIAILSLNIRDRLVKNTINL